MPSFISRIAVGLSLASSACAAGAPGHSSVARPAGPEPVDYTVAFPDLSAHSATITARFPTSGKPTVDLMMAVWSPGYYKVENYADRVHDVAARSPSGAPLNVVHDARNHWRISTGGAAGVMVSYRVTADQRSVTTDWVGDSLIVLNGAPTFMTISNDVHRPVIVHLELPRGWRSATSLDTVRDAPSDSYRAADYDDVVDSPIIAGDNLRIDRFVVGGSRHAVVDAGSIDGWDSARAARDIARFVAEDRRFWGTLPYDHYVFLNVFRRGGGGLEHRNSTLLTSSAAAYSTPAGYVRWLDFVSHEYFHAMNVKRLRPVELGPFDYEAGPKTPSLWISEGLTTYYGDLMVVRSGLAPDSAFLSAMSALIGQLQMTPGRLVQTLSASSLDAWNSENSGVGMDQANTVSYYTKGTVAGFLLDARIRRLTGDRRSLDDVMRAAYALYSGARGFTPEQFQAVASRIAGSDLSAWFHRVLDTVDELDYSEALAWYGLRFADASTDGERRWRLEIRSDATPAQRAHLAALFAP